MKILIRNLNRATTEVEICDLFKVYGTVLSCDLVMDSETGASKGFAFIQMPNRKDAKTAIRNLNLSNISGQKIRVKTTDIKKNN